MFCVAEFTDDHSIAVVPATWLSKDYKKCWWPPVRLLSEADKMSRKKVQREKNWVTYSVRVLVTAATYKEARAKLSAAEDTSDLQSQAEDKSKETQRPVRNRFKPPYLESSDSDEEVCSTPAVGNSAEKQGKRKRDIVDGPEVPQIPLAPKVHSQSIPFPQTPGGASQLTLVESSETNLFADESSSHDTIGRAECSQPMLTTSGCTFHAPVDSQRARLRAEEQSTSDTVVRAAFSQQLPAISSPQTPVASRSMLVEDCETDLFAEEQSTPGTMARVECSRPVQTSACTPLTSVDCQRARPRPEFERKVFQALEELKSAVTQNTRILQMLQASAVASADVPELPSDVQLPISTVEDLQILEDKVKDDDVLARALLTRLSVIGGADIKSTVSNIMSAVVSSGLATKLNWCGRGNKGKFAFGDLKLTNLVYKAVRRNPYCKRPSEEEFRKVAAEWLRLAYDRNGGRKARELKKLKRIEHEQFARSARHSSDSDSN